jgi:cyclase
MLRPRIIPCLLIHNKGLVKTVNFKNPQYIGDPINTVRIFNEKEVDELAIFDIDASVLNKDPDLELLKKIANQSRMPICYGGGVKSVEMAQKIFALGIEKIAVSSIAIQNPKLLPEIANRVGSQSLIAVVDIKRKLFGGYEIYIHNGKIKTGLEPVNFIKYLENLGIGEVIINSIDNDGMMNGFDFNLIDKVIEGLSIPLTIVGGAGSIIDIEKAIQRYGLLGVGCGSLFVFKGPYKAVLINYPSIKEKKEIFLKNNNKW